MSTEKYAIHRKAEVKALQKSLKVLESCPSNLTTLQVAEKNKLGNWSSKGAITTKAARRDLVWRYKRQAEDIIKKVGKGIFPKHNVRIGQTRYLNEDKRIYS